jgi:hypothetical protein
MTPPPALLAAMQRRVPHPKSSSELWDSSLESESSIRSTQSLSSSQWEEEASDEPG